jgi:hypothetical protein
MLAATVTPLGLLPTAHPKAPVDHPAKSASRP